ncbi:hypothetical protein EC604_25910 [Paenibacillus amylolyticus]|uniref:Butirosin biosynthesis protein H N-terminal domain-containing protein n=1 Tax=Paenibacillus amylolyticus TaxID=1451 RepID=A0A5M9X0A6_PAEAM|nr:BtrH N-terminal domain-containing protein [Paenibacillus amylolyticus]KAA8787271.1 hypothetical protein EC604_25910 [Paenibacillus amylolyticus]
MLDIQPLKSFNTQFQVTSCIDDHFRTISTWLGRDTRTMYADAWAFEYNADAQQLLLDRVVYPRLNLGYLDTYHGIQVDFRDRNFSGTTLNSNEDEKPFLDMLQSELDAGMAVLVGIDVYYCPWSDGYLKTHARHSCLAVGIDQKDQKIMLVDAYYGQKNMEMELQLFLNISFYYAIFRLTDPCSSHNDWKGLLSSSLHDQTSIPTMRNSIRNLKDFAKAYSEEGIVISDPKIDTQHAIFQWMRFSLARLRYASFIFYLHELSQEDMFHTIGRHYLELARKWDAIMHQSIKSSFSGDPVNQRQKIYNKMLFIIQNESELLNQLQDLA